VAEQQILGFATGAAPRNRTTKDSELFELLAVSATFDGTAAAGDFVPAVVIISDSGDVVGRFPCAAVLATGDSAFVTFAPFLRNDTGLTGIFYDFANKGDWLSIEATGTGAHLGSSIYLKTAGDLRWDIGNDWDIDTIGQDWNISGPTRDWNVSPGRDWNTGSGRDTNLNTGRDFNILTTGALNAIGTTGIFLGIKAGTSVTVQDHLGNAIFRVDENGDLHGKTGKSLVFDL
jgi:hypothetical protein